MSAPSEPFVPQWAYDAVWYQIFPERFRNGAPQSNPRPEDLGDPWPAGWSVCPWGMDWYTQCEWEKSLGDFYRAVHLRRFGGDLVGLREKLDYLQALGINALYLNPIFWAPSAHKYDAACLHHVDPTLGPDRAGDLAALARARETEDPRTWIWTSADRFFLDLVADIHRRGMRVILDGVFNHSGTRFFAFEDLRRRGRQSRYRDWYRITRWHRDGSFEYAGWFGFKNLPEFGRDADNLNAPVRRYLFDVTRRWMDPDGDGDPSDGIDGWRLDVAFCIPHGFWKEWRAWAKGINPKAFLCGEAVDLASDYVRHDELDAVMNYAWLFPAMQFFAPSRSPISASELRDRLDRVLRAYPPDARAALWNLLDSHDLGRVLSVLENPESVCGDWDGYFDASRAARHPEFVTTRPGARARTILRQLVVFQMTFLGAPVIYYGTEVGMWGANDPDNRQPMLWHDLAYEPERFGPRGPCPESPREPDQELLAFFRRAIALRREHAVFRRGQVVWLKLPQSRVLAYERRLDDAQVRVYLNASDQEEAVSLDRTAHDLWTGEFVRAGSLPVAPRGWRILEFAPVPSP